MRRSRCSCAPTPTASRSSTRRCTSARPARTTGGRPRSGWPTPCTATAGSCTTHPATRTGSTRRACTRSRRATTRLRARRAPGSAGVGDGCGALPGLPRPVRALRAGGDASDPRVGGRRRVGRRGDRLGPRRLGAALRRRPRGRRGAPRPPRRPRRDRALPDARLPGRVEPPLQRVDVRRRRSAARRRRGAHLARRGGARARAQGARRPHEQPHGRHPRLVRRGAGRSGCARARLLLLPRGRQLRRVARARVAAEAQLELARAAAPLHRGARLGRGALAATPPIRSTAGASTSPT